MTNPNESDPLVKSTEEKQQAADPQQMVHDGESTDGSAGGSPASDNALMGRLKAILAQPNDSTQKTLAVALIMCLACSVVVSTAAIALRPTQAENAAVDRKRNIVQVAGLLGADGDVAAAFKNVERRIVDLETGKFTDKFMDTEYDQYAAARDPELSTQLDRKEDIAGIGSTARYAEIFLVGNSEEYTQVILPVNGKGLWSTLYGFVALESDLRTISGLKFYDHKETPGLGGEISNPVWQSKWEGKLAYDESGDVQIEVLKGVVEPNTPNAQYKVDGLAGATLTSRGVSQLMRFWLDDQRFGAFLNNLRQKEA